LGKGQGGFARLTRPEQPDGRKLLQELVELLLGLALKHPCILCDYWRKYMVNYYI
jgi:hypothetical protein